ncbi:type IV pilus modification protein PilV [Variovorax sp. RHLX14]|uniref:type IV pilus modification protein PilV n=1 Tax=Variovorax sp. RHLX14 TaxID=1259731 RepID=UPI003F47C3F9
MAKKRTSLAQKARGSTLIEVLVAVLLLSIGMIGMIGLQAASLQNNREARLQSTAVRLATELAEQMRGNRGVAALPDAATNPYLQANATAAPTKTAVDCFTASCANPLDVARWEIDDWLQRVFSPDGGLPAARVVVCFDQTPYDSAGLPRWACSGSGDVAQVKLGWTRASTDRSLTGAAAFARAGDPDSRPAVMLPIAAGWPS